MTIIERNQIENTLRSHKEDIQEAYIDAQNFEFDLCQSPTTTEAQLVIARTTTDNLRKLAELVFG